MSNLYSTQGLADRLVFQTAIGGSVVAFGLGLAQFMLDQRSSARAFLVHRSLTPSQLFRGKLLVGLGIYALGVGGPLMLLTLYLSWISDRFPCTPFQTIPAWVISIFCTAFYFAACLVSCSNARWFGTRCFPIVGSILTPKTRGLSPGISPATTLPRYKSRSRRLDHGVRSGRR